MRFSRYSLLPVLTVAIATLFGGQTVATASITTLDFEGLPLANYFFGGNVNVGNYYAGNPNGPVFGPDATILDRAIFGYNDGAFPPSSGNAVLFTDTNPNIDVVFTTGPVSMVSLYYRSGTTLFLDAYDSGNNLIGTDSGPANVAPNNPAQFLSLSFGSNQIDRVTIRDSGNFYAIDDFTYDSGSVIPEPATFVVWSLLGLAGAGCCWWRRINV